MLWITKRHRAANTAVPKQAVRMWVRARTHILTACLGTAVLAARWRLVIQSMGWVTGSYATECITLDCFIVRRIS